MINDNLVWCPGNNFGDKLSPVLYKHLTGRDAVFRPKTFKGKKFVSIGSILNWASPGDIVWGAGLARRTDNVSKDLFIKAVRGPLTRDICLSRGVKAPEVYGDPAMLLPLFYERSPVITTTLGIIPHIVDIPHVRIAGPGIKIINLTDPIDKVIKDITECVAVISSSLHGLIVADAYDIPNMWVKITDKVLGDGTKFNDHFLAVGRATKKPLVLSGNMKVEEMVNMIEPEEVVFDRDKLLAACPFKLQSEALNVNK